MTVADAIRELRELRASLAATTEALSGPRMRWRACRDAIARDCYSLDHDNQILRHWSPLGAANIATLDVERSAYLDAAKDLEAQERILKEAVRKAEIELKAAERDQKKTAETSSKTASVSSSQPPQMSLF